MGGRITVFETLKAKKDRLDLVPKLMGERAEKSLALSFEGARSRSGCVALLFGFFSMLIDRGSRAKIQEVQDRPTAIDGDPIGDRFRSFIQHGQEHAPEDCQFPENI